MSNPEDPLKIEDPFELLKLLVKKMDVIIDSTDGQEIHVETSKEFLTNKVDNNLRSFVRSLACSASSRRAWSIFAKTGAIIFRFNCILLLAS